ncbi:MAG: hypothetical protein J6D18_04770, partial [Erysipelotrichaceae bacterium]|nr:hypothetical protein [Erysipelotrichaceae bacterium]
QECIVVEDAANGILAGARAGMFTVMIPDLEQPQPELKPYLNRCYKSLSALLDDMKKGEV